MNDRTIFEYRRRTKSPANSEAASLSIQPLQIGKNQLRQIIAITSLQQTESGHAQPTDRLAEPMIVLRLQRFLRQRIARIGVEARRHRDEFRLELFQTLKGLGKYAAIFLPWRARSDRKVETIVAHVRRAGAGITRILVNGEKRRARLVDQDGFGAVAVMHVKIVNRHPFDTRRQRFQDGDGDVVQIAK